MTTGDVRPQSNNVLPFDAACKIADLSRSTMYRLINAGRGPRVLKLSERRIGIRRNDLDAWLASRDRPLIQLVDVQKITGEANNGRA
ncbi:helix-turn-helix transcriptional regulator [Methylorubrum thiocyanatum]|uniref:DNA-binding transcriptional regulator AlpA n=1 Tax=Methylorubrum thiocyanatum TaxID=47958 RepID=A0AA40S0S3_9HYPH|nr:helix-turn-helix domain-containing protein [Methylorubrum thiocyanatum]MBA8912268.1 putative DNA-binding transcriptional regulator AlpA [Methylorubrum thiocyanatum]